MLALHFIISSRSVLTEIKAVCQQPAEHACIINHVCGFFVVQKNIAVHRSKGEKKKVIKGKIVFKMWGVDLDIHKGNGHKQIQNLLAACTCAIV